MIDLSIFIFYALTMSIYKKKHIENMQLFYFVAMETDHNSWSSCFLDAKFAMFLHILRCKLEKYVDFPAILLSFTY